MSLTAVEQWSTTAASNTTLGASITLDGTVMTPSQVDDGFRELMAQIATWRTAGTFTGASWTLTYTDAGAAVGPTLTLYRDSASPAASDVIGAISYQGRDSAANAQVYAVDDVVITDPTSTSEDAARRIRTVVAGTLTTAFQFASTGNVSQYTLVPFTDDGAALGTTSLEWSDLFLASGGVINWNNGDVTLTHSANTLTFGGASSGYLFDAVAAPSSNDGAALGNSSNQWSDLYLASGSVLNFGGSNLTVVHSAGILDFSTGTYRFQTPGTSTPGSGNNSSGVVIDSAGTIYASRGGNSAVFNRTADGNLVNFNSAGVNQGIISISGATTTYGAFFGSHWSQTADGSKPDILRGTICESIDEMCEWPGEGPEERLPRFKISDKAGSRAVYGVFAWWEIWDGEGDAPTNDAFIGSLGAFVIRIAPGVDVQRGDYIESNGDGCGRVQKGDELRASTVAKITSGIPVDTYPDGSRLFPCTLHCG